MTRYTLPIRGLCLILVLTSTLIPTQARAGDDASERTIHLRTTESFGPIGTASSLGAFGIEGRLTQREESVWGGELIHAFSKASVRVELDSIGQVTLKGGATARLAAAVTGTDGANRHLLVASLIEGEMSVDLQPRAGAYVESRGSAFSASGGASFKIGTRDGQAAVVTASGGVQVSPQASRRPDKIRPVELGPDPLQRPRYLGLTLDVNERTDRQSQFQVTDEHDKPVPDVPVILTIAGNIGRFGNAFTFSGTTNAQGVVSAPFTASSAPAQGSITANVPGTNVSCNVEVTVKAKPPALRNKILIGAAALAAIIIIADPFGEKGPIQQAPPPAIVP